MDLHEIADGVAMDDVAKAHLAGLQAQTAHDVRYLRYLVDEEHGWVFCLAEAPSADAAADVHRQAHGLVADHIYRVQDGSQGTDRGLPPRPNAPPLRIRRPHVGR